LRPGMAMPMAMPMGTGADTGTLPKPTWYLLSCRGSDAVSHGILPHVHLSSKPHTSPGCLAAHAGPKPKNAACVRDLPS
jgi:hypothetical protein